MKKALLILLLCSCKAQVPPTPLQARSAMPASVTVVDEEVVPATNWVLHFDLSSYNNLRIDRWEFQGTTNFIDWYFICSTNPATVKKTHQWEFFRQQATTAP